jgi:hypothetical protein
LNQRTDQTRPSIIENPRVSREDIEFQHPSEREFARVLDYYGIAWRYEPVTFPTDWDDEGNLLEAFSPDFFLVEQDLYVELTTLRQSLTRLKRRKLRRLRELYPEVRVQLWSRKDFRRLLERLGIEERGKELIGQNAKDS